MSWWYANYCYIMWNMWVKLMKSIQSWWDNHVKVPNINCNYSITLCDNCKQSIIACVPGEMSVKSCTGPMRQFCAITEVYINQEHTGLVCIMFGNLVSGWTGCVGDEMKCESNHSRLLSCKWMGILVHWEWMCEKVKYCARPSLHSDKRKELSVNHLVLSF